MNTHQPLISIQYVSKTYGNPLEYSSLVLKNVSLNIYDGEFVVIFGPSGSGKSTLLNLMAGLENPTAGKVLVRGRDLAQFDQVEMARYHRLYLGMVFQQFNLIKSLNVWENVALPQTANGVGYFARKKRAEYLLKLFNIDNYKNRRPSEVSGGEQQRVAIARALVNNPYFLLVDEPTGNLDSRSADEVMKIFAGLHQHGKHTIVMVTHNPEQLHYASRVVYVQDGAIKKQEKYDPVTKVITPILPEEHFKSLGKDPVAVDPVQPSHPTATVPAATSPVSPLTPQNEPLVMPPTIAPINPPLASTVLSSEPVLPDLVQPPPLGPIGSPNVSDNNPLLGTEPS